MSYDPVLTCFYNLYDSTAQVCFWLHLCRWEYPALDIRIFAQKYLCIHHQGRYLIIGTDSLFVVGIRPAYGSSWKKCNKPGLQSSRVLSIATDDRKKYNRTDREYRIADRLKMCSVTYGRKISNRLGENAWLPPPRSWYPDRGQW